MNCIGMTYFIIFLKASMSLRSTKRFNASFSAVTVNTVNLSLFSSMSKYFLIPPGTVLVQSCPNYMEKRVMLKHGRKI